MVTLTFNQQKKGEPSFDVYVKAAYVEYAGPPRFSVSGFKEPRKLNALLNTPPSRGGR